MEGKEVDSRQVVKIHTGQRIVIGRDPKSADRKFSKDSSMVKIEGLNDEFLSRAAVAMYYKPDGTVSIGTLTDKNKVSVWVLGGRSGWLNKPLNVNGERSVDGTREGIIIDIRTEKNLIRMYNTGGWGGDGREGEARYRFDINPTVLDPNEY